MDRVFKLITKDPLFEFLSLGLILYLVVSFITPTTPVQSQKKQLVIPSLLLHNYPFDTNTSAALATYKTVLLEESYFLELYKQDPVIQKLLFTKEELLLQNSIKIKEPTQKELKEYFLTHKQNYYTPKSFSYLLLKLPHSKTSIISQLNLLKLQPKNAIKYENITQKQLQKECGNYFLHQLKRAPLHHWSVPLKCKNQLYSFYIIQKEPYSLEENIDFEMVEDQVYKDYTLLQKQKAFQQAYQKLLQHYKIEIQ